MVDTLAPPKTVLLRGLVGSLRAEIESGTGLKDLAEAFPSARIFEISFVPDPKLVALNGGVTTQAEEAHLLSLAQQVELLAMLTWSDAIWHDRNCHFIVPSGHHADKFVRPSDMFSDQINISRIADWLYPAAAAASCVTADTDMLLPLLQELRVRHIQRTTTDLKLRIVPLYGSTPKQIRIVLEDIVPFARERNNQLLMLLSVSASGGYIREMTANLAEFQDPPHGVFRILCQAGGDKREDSLCYVEVRQYPNQSVCEMCTVDRTAPIQIDQRRFMTRIGTRLLSLPSAADMQEHAPILVDAVKMGAFKVHVDRPTRHQHLGIYIDTQTLLTSRIFKAKATIGLARCLLGFSPDLILVPAHDATPAMQSWLAAEGLPGAQSLSLSGNVPDSLKCRIQNAKCILLCDDAVITSRSMRAALDIVQVFKEQAGFDTFTAIRAFALVARPSSFDVWKGLSDRFYIEKVRKLFAGWEFNLPDMGYGRGETCPWCEERELLERLLPDAPVPAREYLERRFARLSDPNGLTSQIYFLSEAAGEVRDWEAAIHTTPASYLGSTSDLGAYVGTAALVQKMRNDWNRSIERWSTAYAIPLHEALRHFTDPVIAAGFIRSVNRHELQVASVAEGLTPTLLMLDHYQKHPVFAAEVVLAALQRKLPTGLGVAPLARLFQPLPEPYASTMSHLLQKVTT
jgi:hypothetical protein